MSSFDAPNDSPDPEQLVREVISGRIAAVRRMPSGDWSRELGPSPRGLLSGSFNPRHDGHVALRLAAERWLRLPVGYELSVANADKPSLAGDELSRRCGQFDDAPVVVTRCGGFVDKAQIVAGSVFVVGADTALRVLDEKYYADTGGLHCALGRIRDQQCRFLVACRHFRGRLVTAAELPVPADFSDLFEMLPAEHFRCDVSSSAIRESDVC